MAVLGLERLASRCLHRRTFLDNRLKTLVAVDFFVVPTIRFQILYAFVVLAHERRRIVHFAVTAHPTAEWTSLLPTLTPAINGTQLGVRGPRASPSTIDETQATVTSDRLPTVERDMSHVDVCRLC